MRMTERYSDETYQAPLPVRERHSRFSRCEGGERGERAYGTISQSSTYN